MIFQVNIIVILQTKKEENEEVEKEKEKSFKIINKKVKLNSKENDKYYEVNLMNFL